MANVEDAPSEEPSSLRSQFGDLAWLLAPNAYFPLAILLLASFALRIIFLNQSGRGLIFDEAYYVNAARVILGIAVPHGQHYFGSPTGIDPNWEHPPLGKLMFAGTMALFGDNPLGWRLTSIVLGTAAIAVIYLIVRAAGGSGWLAFLGATIFSLDNLVLVHSRIATLDMPMLFFLLVAAWLALRRLPLAAGAVAGVASLVKLEAWYGLLAIALIEAGLIAWRWRSTRRRVAWQTVLIQYGFLIGSFAVVLIVGLAILDSFVGHFHNPFDHLSYMIHYGLALTRPNGPQGIESYPWQWLANEVQITYFRVDQNILVNGSVTQTRPLIWFRGAMNPAIIGAAGIGVGYSLMRAWRYGEVLSMWVAGWIVGNYLPYYPLAMLEHRISYIFYFLPTVPAIAIALAQMLLDKNIPRWVLVTFMCTVVIGFIAYYPFRTL